MSGWVYCCSIGVFRNGVLSVCSMLCSELVGCVESERF